jgi:hypothetical protein
MKRSVHNLADGAFNKPESGDGRAEILTVSEPKAPKKGAFRTGFFFLWFYAAVLFLSCEKKPEPETEQFPGSFLREGPIPF